MRSGANADKDARCSIFCQAIGLVIPELLVSGPQAIVEHLEKHKSVYESIHLLPKHHFAIHLPEQFARDGVLTDCFVVERSHLLPRSVANDIDNTITFEKSAIQNVLLARVESLESFDERSGLTGQTAAICLELAAALGADAALAAAPAPEAALTPSGGAPAALAASASDAAGARRVKWMTSIMILQQTTMRVHVR